MKKLLVFFCATIMVLGFIGTPSLVFAESYYGYDEYGGTWYDAEKTPGNTEDDLMCWAAATSNILAWTGWGYPSGAGFINEDDIFGYYQDHWTDQGGIMEFGWDWWFDGTNTSQGWDGWSQVDVPGGGFYPTYNFQDYYYRTGQDSLAMSSIDNYLHNGYGVTIAIYGPGGHALTVWGYEYDINGNYLGIYVTDSDNSKSSNDPPDVLGYYNVSLEENAWYLQDFYGADTWFIGEVLALDQSPLPIQNHAPIPSAIWLLGSGLIGIVGIRRRLKK